MFLHQYVFTDLYKSANFFQKYVVVEHPDEGRK